MIRKEKLFIIWAVTALLLAVVISTSFRTSFPIFTVIWISVPIIAVIRNKDAGSVGFKRIPLKELIKFTIINLVLTLSIYGIFEPWSHTYKRLLELITSSKTPDVTFIWITKYSGMKALASMLLFSGFVTLFGEELFFRGWLLQYLKKRLNSYWAIIIQAVIFMIPNALVAFFMSPMKGVLYTVIYSAVAIGIVGGWTSKCTNSIWPSLISASIVNLIAVVVLI